MNKPSETDSRTLDMPETPTRQQFELALDYWLRGVIRADRPISNDAALPLWTRPEPIVFSWPRHAARPLDEGEREKLEEIANGATAPTGARSAVDYMSRKGAWNNTDSGKRDRLVAQAVRLAQGMASAVLAADALRSWSPRRNDDARSERFETFAKAATTCLAAYRDVWPLVPSISTSTADGAALKTSGSDLSRSSAAVELLRTQLMAQPPHRFSTSDYLALRQLMQYLLGETVRLFPEQAPPNELSASELPLLLDLGHERGAVDRAFVIREPAERVGWFFDPVLLGLKLFDEDFLNPFDIGWRCSAKRMLDHAKTNGWPHALRFGFHPDQDHRLLLEGPSAGGLVALGMHAAAEGTLFNTGDSFTAAVMTDWPRRGTPDQPDPADEQLELSQVNTAPVDKDSIVPKLDAFSKFLPKNVTARDATGRTVYVAHNQDLGPALLEGLEPAPRESSDPHGERNGGPRTFTFGPLTVRRTDNLADAHRQLTGDARIERVISLVCGKIGMRSDPDGAANTPKVSDAGHLGEGCRILLVTSCPDAAPKELFAMAADIANRTETNGRKSLPVTVARGGDIQPREFDWSQPEKRNKNLKHLVENKIEKGDAANFSEVAASHFLESGRVVLLLDLAEQGEYASDLVGRLVSFLKSSVGQKTRVVAFSSANGRSSAHGDVLSLSKRQSQPITWEVREKTKSAPQCELERELLPSPANAHGDAAGPNASSQPEDRHCETPDIHGTDSVCAEREGTDAHSPQTIGDFKSDSGSSAIEATNQKVLEASPRGPKALFLLAVSLSISVAGLALFLRPRSVTAPSFHVVFTRFTTVQDLTDDKDDRWDGIDTSKEILPDVMRPFRLLTTGQATQLSQTRGKNQFIGGEFVLADHTRQPLLPYIADFEISGSGLINAWLMLVLYDREGERIGASRLIEWSWEASAELPRDRDARSTFEFVPNTASHADDTRGTVLLFVFPLDSKSADLLADAVFPTIVQKHDSGYNSKNAASAGLVPFRLRSTASGLSQPRSLRKEK